MLAVHQELPLASLGLDVETLDGPFVLPAKLGVGPGAFGMLASLRGKDGGSLVGPEGLGWARDLPARLRADGAHVFVRRGDGALYLGYARVAGKGRVSVEGYKTLFRLEASIPPGLFDQLVHLASASPPPPPEEAIVALSKASTTSERLDAMRVFLARWFQLSVDDDALAVALRQRRAVPAPLAALHAIAGETRLCVQNSLVALGELVPTPEGKVPFYVENQGVLTWAVDATALHDDDPPVLVRSEGGWASEMVPLSSFLLAVLVLEACFGAPFGASHEAVEPVELRALVRKLPRLPLHRWSASRATFLGGGGVLGVVFESEPGASVWVGARDRERLLPLASRLMAWPDARV